MLINVREYLPRLLEVCLADSLISFFQVPVAQRDSRTGQLYFRPRFLQVSFALPQVRKYRACVNLLRLHRPERSMSEPNPLHMDIVTFDYSSYLTVIGRLSTAESS